jgi:hypothetical protein
MARRHTVRHRAARHTSTRRRVTHRARKHKAKKPAKLHVHHVHRAAHGHIYLF